MFFTDWWTSRGLARATAYRLLFIAGIKPQKIPVQGYKVLRPILTDEQVAFMDEIGDRFLGGESTYEIDEDLNGGKL
jgi:hypothetical protein